MESAECRQRGLNENMQRKKHFRISDPFRILSVFHGIPYAKSMLLTLNHLKSSTQSFIFF